MSAPQIIGQAAVATLAGVLIVAGASKLRRPEQLQRALRAVGAPRAAALVRALAAFELLGGLLALALPLRVAACALAVLFAGLAAAAAALARAGWEEDCGCFGESGQRAGMPRLRALLNLIAAAVAVAIVILGPSATAAALLGGPGGVAAMLIAALAASGVAGGLARRSGAPVSARAATRIAAPMLDELARRLVSGSAMFLERRFSRRSLVRLALAGSALSVAPLRYLLCPEPALAVIVPGSCASGLCTDGYTAFCCEINEGLNQCPSGTFPAGWWMCTDYAGRQLCRENGVRYYVDCNALPERPFPGGCVCANGSCENRRANCNVFRYGQCNTHLPGVTAVVCRMVTCQRPSSIAALNCNDSLAVDDAVCGHDVPCLEPMAVALEGAGGA